MADFLVVGGGIAGAAAGFFLARNGTVTLLEAESALGTHSTGRSAALFSEYYGGPEVRAMTAASRSFYTTPPPGFADVELLRPRGVLAVAPVGTSGRFEAALRSGSDAPQGVHAITMAEARQLYPVLRPGLFERAMFRPGACDLDVAAAHQGFLRGIRAGGGRIVSAARVRSLAWRSGWWHAETPAGRFSAPVLVNAAGAWADEVAGLAGVPRLGLVSRRRTIVLVPGPHGYPAATVARWPMLADVTETFYAKPESGGLLLSPVDTEPMAAGSPRAADVDVAMAIARFEAATTVRVRRVIRAWAGLRSAVDEDVPVIGEAPATPGFFWLAGLGGYGIQLAPAAGARLAALVSGEARERVSARP